MYEDRSASINIAGVEYPLLFNTRAAKAVANKYGGLEEIADKLEDPATALDDYVWLLVLLMNQPILLHNYLNKDDKKERNSAFEQIRRGALVDAFGFTFGFVGGP